MSTDLTLPELISPEGLQVAQSYLMNDGSMEKTARDLDLPVELVQNHLDTREVKNYVDRAYHEMGFRNKFKIAKVMDAIIEAKLEEMDETGLGSAKDIADLIQLQHKMKMEYINAELKMMELQMKAEKQDVVNQTNVQVNALAGGDGYNALLDKLLG